MLKRFVLVLAVALSGFMGSACADSSGQFIATDPTPLVAATAKGPVAFSVEIADDPGEREHDLAHPFPLFPTVYRRSGEGSLTDR